MLSVIVLAACHRRYRMAPVRDNWLAIGSSTENSGADLLTRFPPLSITTIGGVVSQETTRDLGMLLELQFDLAITDTSSICCG